MGWKPGTVTFRLTVLQSIWRHYYGWKGFIAVSFMIPGVVILVLYFLGRVEHYPSVAQMVPEETPIKEEAGTNAEETLRSHLEESSRLLTAPAFFTRFHKGGGL